jgi:hypothetical protein
MAASGYFPPRASDEKTHYRCLKGALCIAKQNSRPPPSSAALRPSAPLRVLTRSARRQVIATKAAMGAADLAKDLFP